MYENRENEERRQRRLAKEWKEKYEQEYTAAQWKMISMLKPDDYASYFRRLEHPSLLFRSLENRLRYEMPLHSFEKAFVLWYSTCVLSRCQ